MREPQDICPDRLPAASRLKAGRSARPTPERSARRGVTLIEMLTVVAIISILAALLIPAVNAARESSRALACSHNLRQLAVGLIAQSSRENRFCTGAFDWRRDGAVTEIGWVADLVNAEVAVGKCLCPSNPAQIAATYQDLLTMDVTALDNCVDYAGSPGKPDPSGVVRKNPCRVIIESAMTPGEARRAIILKEILEKHYNTNYAASWLLVRGGPVLDADGNLRGDPEKPSCPVGLDQRNGTQGPLRRTISEAAQIGSSFQPLLGDAAVAGLLPESLGPHQIGAPMAASFTAGPVEKTTMQVITFPSGTPYNGPDGWWAGWTERTLQDYRRFAPVHRGVCNVAFADGSVRGFKDTDGDGLINSGFPPLPVNGFATAEVELPPEEFFVGWSLGELPR